MPLLLDSWCSNGQEENNQTDTVSSDTFKFFIQAMETSPNEYNMLSLNYTWDIQDKMEIYKWSSGEWFRIEMSIWIQ